MLRVMFKPKSKIRENSSCNPIHQTVLEEGLARGKGGRVTLGLEQHRTQVEMKDEVLAAWIME